MNSRPAPSVSDMFAVRAAIRTVIGLSVWFWTTTGIWNESPKLRKRGGDGRTISGRRAVIALSPQGRQLTQPIVEELAAYGRLTLLSARYEGFDERIVEHLATDAISIGPYVLSNGDLPAMVLVDAIARRLPGAHQL